MFAILIMDQAIKLVMIYYVPFAFAIETLNFVTAFFGMDPSITSNKENRNWMPYTMKYVPTSKPLKTPKHNSAPAKSFYPPISRPSRLHPGRI